jgi:predicted dehydrogenase
LALQSHKWAIIGASTVATQHILPTLVKVKHSRAEILFSRQGKTSEALANANGLRLTSQLRDVLQSDVDCAYVGSLNTERYQICKLLLEAGKHVMAEKPMTLSIQESRNLIRLAQKKRRVLAVNHHLPTAGAHKKIRA